MLSKCLALEPEELILGRKGLLTRLGFLSLMTALLWSSLQQPCELVTPI